MKKEETHFYSTEISIMLKNLLTNRVRYSVGRTLGYYVTPSQEADGSLTSDKISNLIKDFGIRRLEEVAKIYNEVYNLRSKSEIVQRLANFKSIKDVRRFNEDYSKGLSFLESVKEVLREKERRNEKEVEEKKKRKWAKYLVNWGYEDNETAKMLTEVLEDPESCHVHWFSDAIEAVEENKARSGIISQEAEETGWDYQKIRACIRAYRRHNYTNYDELLKAGLSKDEARDEMEYVK